MAEARKINVPAGAVVTLKSGGPRMTVRERVACAAGEVYRCVWFDQNEMVHEAVFDINMLFCV